MDALQMVTRSFALNLTSFVLMLTSPVPANVFIVFAGTCARW